MQGGQSSRGGFQGQAGGPSYSAQQGTFVPKFVFDGKRMRKPVVRRTVDFNSSVIKRLKKYPFTVRHSASDFDAMFPESNHVINILPPDNYSHSPSSCITTKFVHTSTNKIRCPVNIAKVPVLLIVVDAGGQEADYRLVEWRVYAVEWAYF